MDAETVGRLVSLAATFIAAAAAGVCAVLATRWRRVAEHEHRHALEADAEVEAMRRAQDPGREVHERLAAALEASIVRTGGPVSGDPAMRRAAAMAMAAGLIDGVRRAGLVLAVDDEPVDLDAARAAADQDLAARS